MFTKKSKMFNEIRKEIPFGDQTLVLETGKIARQAHGAVMATLGETMVLATVVGKKEAVEGQDFFPLTVHYQEKFSASGKIPGSFNRREGMPSTHETLTSRLIDRPIRPLFPEGYKNEVQIICTTYNYDKENQADIVALVAASAALSISGIPFMGPIGGSRVALIDGDFKLNPTNTEMLSSDLDLIVAGTQEGVLMVESEAQNLDEKTMLSAVKFGHDGFLPVIEGINELAKEVNNERWEIADNSKCETKSFKEVEKKCRKGLEKAFSIKTKAERYAAVDAVKSELKESFEADFQKEMAKVSVAELEAKMKEKKQRWSCLSNAFHKLEGDVVRQSILKTGKRIDGRKTNDIRPIECEVGVLSKNHGSALFTRGETQALVSTTLGVKDDEQLIDSLDGVSFDRFMLHYNFPPFSVGECGRLGRAGRREIGHGKLAFRANNPMMPTHEEFPYTIRVLSDVTESNGSSSMATTCGASLAMMDAGVPVKDAVSGIAMGLIKEGKEFAVLSDIMGDEDHLGDMDFKVAGTKKGITSLQMDLKITSITFDIMEQALEQAKDGRIHILKQMAKAIKAPRKELSSEAPQIAIVEIDASKIKDVIGSGGKVIKEITAETDCKIEIKEEGRKGTVVIAGSTENIAKAKAIIEGIVKEPEFGEVYDGEVVDMKPFGAFVNLMPGKDGFLHISEISDERTENIEDAIKVGQVVKVVVLGMDRGKVKVSMKRVGQKLNKKDFENQDNGRDRRPRRK